MSLSTEQLVILHDEYSGDSIPVSPLLAEYNAIFANGSLDRVGKAQALADKINSIETNRTRIRASMSGSEMFKATVAGDFSSLPDGKKQEWLSYCGIDTHDPESGGVAEQFVKYIFGNPSNTVSALATARQETISRRAEIELPQISSADVLEALLDLLPA